MAVALAKAGADIVGVGASLNPVRSDVGDEVEALGREFKGYQADFTDRAALYSFIKCLDEQEENIDILVNNAGTILRAPAAEHSDAFWDAVMEVNPMHNLYCEEIGKKMIEKDGKDHFHRFTFNIQGGITVPSYAASKEIIGQLVMALSMNGHQKVCRLMRLSRLHRHG